MSKPKDQKPPGLPPLTQLHILPPKSEEMVPPSFVNQTWVSGNADSISLHMYYQPISVTRAIQTALRPEGDRRHLEPYMTVDGPALIVHLPTISRVTMSPTVALDLAISIMETFIDGLPDLKGDVEDLAQRMTIIGEKLSQMAGGGKQ